MSVRNQFSLLHENKHEVNKIKREKNLSAKKVKKSHPVSNRPKHIDFATGEFHSKIIHNLQRFCWLQADKLKQTLVALVEVGILRAHSVQHSAPNHNNLRLGRG